MNGAGSGVAQGSFIKTIAIAFSLVFICVTIAWSAPDLCLRPRPALERGTGFVFQRAETVCPGVRKADVTFLRGGRFARGWVVEIQPKIVECRGQVDPRMVYYNFHASASTLDLARQYRRKHVPLPGKTIPQFKQELPPEERQRAVLVGPWTQGGFWCGNTAVKIETGPTLITKTTPGLFQTEVMQPNGDFYFLVLDPGKVGVRRIELINGVPQEDMSDIKLAFVGQPLFYHGQDLSSRVRFPATAEGKPAPIITAYDVNWDPKTTITSFTIWGCNRKTGTIYYFPMVRTSDKKLDGVLFTEMIEAFRQYAAETGIDMDGVDLILGPGGVDTNVILGDEELVSTVDPRSATAKDYPNGRPLGTIFYALAKTRFDVFGIRSWLREKRCERLAGKAGLEAGTAEFNTAVQRGMELGERNPRLIRAFYKDVPIVRKAADTPFQFYTYLDLEMRLIERGIPIEVTFSETMPHIVSYLRPAPAELKRLSAALGDVMIGLTARGMDPTDASGYVDLNMISAAKTCDELELYLRVVTGCARSGVAMRHIDSFAKVAVRLVERSPVGTEERHLFANLAVELAERGINPVNLFTDVMPSIRHLERTPEQLERFAVAIEDVAVRLKEKGVESDHFFEFDIPAMTAQADTLEEVTASCRAFLERIESAERIRDLASGV